MDNTAKPLEKIFRYMNEYYCNKLNVIWKVEKFLHEETTLICDIIINPMRALVW